MMKCVEFLFPAVPISLERVSHHVTLKIKRGYLHVCQEDGSSTSPWAWPPTPAYPSSAKLLSFPDVLWQHRNVVSLHMGLILWLLVKPGVVMEMTGHVKGRARREEATLIERQTVLKMESRKVLGPRFFLLSEHVWWADSSMSCVSWLGWTVFSLSPCDGGARAAPPASLRHSSQLGHRDW